MAKKPSDLPPGHYNPVLDRLRSKEKRSPGHTHAPKQERKLAKTAKVWATPGSGNKRQKGDVRVSGIARIECKTTSKKSFSLTREMVDKIENAAGALGEVPIIQVDFLGDDGKVAAAIAVVPMYVLKKLIADA